MPSMIGTWIPRTRARCGRPSQNRESWSTSNVVVDAHERPAADQAAPVRAQVERPQQGQHHEHPGTPTSERREEQLRRGARHARFRSPAGRVTPATWRAGGGVRCGSRLRNPRGCPCGRLTLLRPERHAASRRRDLGLDGRRSCRRHRQGGQGATTVKPWSVAYWVTLVWRFCHGLPTRVLAPPCDLGQVVGVGLVHEVRDRRPLERGIDRWRGRRRDLVELLAAEELGGVSRPLGVLERRRW